MLGTSTIPRTRRARRRRIAWGLLFWTASAALFVTATLASYRIGRSQGEIELARLTGDLADQQELHRLTIAAPGRGRAAGRGRGGPPCPAAPAAAQPGAEPRAAPLGGAGRRAPARRRAGGAAGVRHRAGDGRAGVRAGDRIPPHRRPHAVQHRCDRQRHVLRQPGDRHQRGHRRPVGGRDAEPGLRHGAAGHLALPRDRRRGRHRLRSACRWRMRWRSRARSSASRSGPSERNRAELEVSAQRCQLP